MNYEKSYKEALERASKIKLRNPIGRIKDEIDGIFPELKESENERIRKELKRAIAVALDYSYFDKETADNCISWLEKQGEQKWSEEDELNLKQAIYVCHQNGYTAVENWLKSIKPNHWKPSEEQMNSLLALSVLHKESKALESLYNDLKKL